MMEKGFAFIERCRGTVRFIGDRQPETGEFLYWMSLREDWAADVRIVEVYNRGMSYDGGKSGKNYLQLIDRGQAAFHERKPMFPEVSGADPGASAVSPLGWGYALQRTEAVDLLVCGFTRALEERDRAQASRRVLEDSLKKVFGDIFSAQKEK